MPMRRHPWGVAAFTPPMTFRRLVCADSPSARTWPFAIGPTAVIVVGKALMEDYLLAFAMVVLTTLFIGLTTVGLVEFA